MTHPPDGKQPEDDRSKPGDQALRDELLQSMSGGECLPLGHIDSVVAYDHPADPLATRQTRVITTISSLLAEGLVDIGQIVGGTDAHVDPWKLSTEDALTRLHQLYVTHHDDEAKWSVAIWFALTPDGERAAAPSKGDTS
ncbi:hypothetical protein [Mycolicibacterium stellerae]|uniref:hypothetical protein n=1 Tax=Mycolicibacterium stellerae TaxID=2358193 RepID=UPI0013DE6B2C|nr:hypothetical protein [Mycolicibacterium stellerae]